MATTNLRDLQKREQGDAAQALAPNKPRNMAEINQLDQKKQFPAMLELFRGQIAAALPEHLTAERMARLAMTAVSNNHTLALCTPTSLFASVILSSQLGLEIGVDGEAFLVPYYDNKARHYVATFIPGWKGYVKLVNQGKEASVWTGAVFKGDRFEFELGDEPFVRHQPTGESDETRANLTHVYCVGRIKGTGEKIIEVWPVRKVERHLARYNKVGDKHYALKNDDNFIAYGRKVALLQVIKYLPKSVKLLAAKAVEQGGVSSVDVRDVLEGDWTNVTAAAGADDISGQLERQGDTTEQPAGDTGTSHDSGAAGATQPPSAEPATSSPTKAGTATAASESPAQDKPKPRGSRRTIE